jgi:hypothetical protein
MSAQASSTRHDLTMCAHGDAGVVERSSRTFSFVRKQE